MTEPVYVLDTDLKLQAVIKPCKAFMTAYLSVPVPSTLYCNDVEGHSGSHYFHVEWGDTSNLRWRPNDD